MICLMTIKSNTTPEERKRLHREDYELQKDGLIDFFHEQKYDEKNLNEFLVNSLKTMGFEQELKEDDLM